MGKSSALTAMVFNLMDNSLRYSIDPGLSDNALGIYFGPDLPATQLMTLKQKAERGGELFKESLLVEEECLQIPIDTCRARLGLWESSVQNLMKSGGYGQEAIDMWGELLSSTVIFSKERIEG